MKRLVIIAGVSLLCVFAACKKGKGPANGNSAQPNNKLDTNTFMSVNINGFNWQTDSIYGYYEQYSGNDSGVVNLLVTANRYGANDSVSTIMFNITNYTGPNTYPVNPPVTSVTYYQSNIRHFATQGEIVISSDSNYAIIGTFIFTADTLTGINGSFNVEEP